MHWLNLVFLLDHRTLWCEVLKNILPDEELVAILLEDDNDKPPSSSSSSSLLPSISSPASSSVDASSSSIKVEAMEVVVVHGLNPSSEGAMPALAPLTALNTASSSSSSVGFVRWENRPNSFFKRGRHRKSAAGLFSETTETEADRQRTTFC